MNNENTTTSTDEPASTTHKIKGFTFQSLFLASIFIFLLCESCAVTNMENYYFPLNIDDDIAVYQYTDFEDPKFSEYWRVIVDPNNRTLQTDSYRYDFEKYNTFVESYEDYGAELTEYVDYEKDKEGNIKQINAEIMAKDVFMWTNKKPYSFSMEYKNKFGNFKFLKRRTFIGTEKMEVFDEEYKAIKFKDEYFVHAVDQNDKYSFYQISYYVKNIGMVKYERFIPNSGPRVLMLEKIMTEDEFDMAKLEFLRNKDK